MDQTTRKGLTIRLYKREADSRVVYIATATCGPRPDHPVNSYASSVDCSTSVLGDPNGEGEPAVDMIQREQMSPSAGPWALKDAVTCGRFACLVCIESNLQPDTCKEPFTSEVPVEFPKLDNPELQN